MRAQAATAAALLQPLRLPLVLNVTATTPPSATACREKTSQICCSRCATAPQWSRYTRWNGGAVGALRASTSRTSAANAAHFGAENSVARRNARTTCVCWFGTNTASGGNPNDASRSPLSLSFANETLCSKATEGSSANDASSSAASSKEADASSRSGNASSSEGAGGSPSPEPGPSRLRNQRRRRRRRRARRSSLPSACAAASAAAVLPSAASRMRAGAADGGTPRQAALAAAAAATAALVKALSADVWFRSPGAA